MFSRILQMIRQVIHRMIPYKSIEQATSIETPLSTEMAQALDDWYDLYRNMAPWRKGKDGADVKSLNLASQIWQHSGPPDCAGDEVEHHGRRG